MIKFFRHIRKSLLMETGKTSKYLKYAIGEIVLVVIGILIALSINNWNEQRKQKDTLNNIYTTLKIDLLEDIKNIDKITSSSELSNKHYLAIINKTRKREDFKTCKRCWMVNFGFPEISLRTNGIDLLLDYNKLVTNSNDTLSINLKKLYNDNASDIQNDLKELTTYTEAYFKEIATEESWFPELTTGIITDDFIEYALTDVTYRNYATIIHFIYFLKYIPHLKEFKAQGMEFIKLIDERIDND